ncbi:MAG: Bcr/CflA family efflux MFS transporter [Gammaproteobacteria bacterium]
MTSEIKFACAQKIFILAALTVVIVGASVDMFVPSLPSIHTVFNTSMQKTQLIVAVYLVSYGIFQLIAGSIADSFGRRKTLLFSLVGFVASTLCIPICRDINVLLGLRFMQGIFAAGIGVCSRVLVSDVFSGVTLAKHASYLTFAWAIGPIFSPYLGGYLQHIWGWQASFYFLGIYSLVIALLIFFMLPETFTVLHRFHIKVILSNYLTIYFNKAFIASTLACGCAYSFVTMYNVVGPFLIQQTLGYSAVVYGRIALVLGIGWLSGNLLCRKIVTQGSSDKVIYIVLSIGIVIAVSMLILARIDYFNLWSAFIPPVLLFMVGGMLFSYCFGKCLSLFPHMGGTASAAMGSLYSVIAAAVSALSTLITSKHLTPLAVSYLIIIILALFFFHLRINTLRK